MFFSYWIEWFLMAFFYVCFKPLAPLTVTESMDIARNQVNAGKIQSEFGILEFTVISDLRMIYINVSDLIVIVLLGCSCKVGWYGENCAKCHPYPGCQNGDCSRPWECNCRYYEYFEIFIAWCDLHRKMCFLFHVFVAERDSVECYAMRVSIVILFYYYV